MHNSSSASSVTKPIEISETPSSSTKFDTRKPQQQQQNSSSSTRISSLTTFKNSQHVVDTLFGTMISECFYGTNFEDGNAGSSGSSSSSRSGGNSGSRTVFFIFPELCIRIEGTYRLKFSLHDLST